MDLSRTFTVMAYEWKRSIASRRFFSWIFLIGFPALVVFLINRMALAVDGGMPLESWGITFFMLIPGVCCMLSLLLAASPYLQSELEGRTWIYLAVRPGVKADVVLGKYCYAVSRTVIAAVAVLAICVLISGQLAEVRLIVVTTMLIVLSSITYATVYIFIGTIMPHRAMVVAVAYSALEFLISLIPAVVNQITVQYRLRSLLIKGMNWDSSDAGQLSGFMAEAEMFSTQPWWQHVGILVVMAGGLIALSIWILTRRELATLKVD